MRAYHLVDPSGGAIDTVRVQTTNGTTVNQPLLVKTAALTLDSSWSPYVQGTIVCVQPSSAVVAQLDPRTGLVVKFTLRQVVDGVTTDQAWQLLVRARSVDWLTGELTLTVSSFDALWTEYADGATLNGVGSAATLDTILNWSLVNSYYPGRTYMTLTTAQNISFSTADQVWSAGQTAWDYSQSLIDAAGAWARIDEAGNQWLTMANQAYDAFTSVGPDTSTHYLNDSAQITALVDRIDRDDQWWANYVVMTFNGNTTAGTGAAQIASASGVGSGFGQFRKTLGVQRPTKLPSAGTPAASLLTRAQRRGLTLAVTALADITARPCQTWSVAYGDATHAGPVQSVNLQLPDGLMTLALNATS